MLALSFNANIEIFSNFKAVFHHHSTALLLYEHYYENFSEDSAYWHQILEQEITFQKQIMNEISENVIVDESIYIQRYQAIEFPDLD